MSSFFMHLNHVRFFTVKLLQKKRKIENGTDFISISSSSFYNLFTKYNITDNVYIYNVLLVMLSVTWLL